MSTWFVYMLRCSDNSLYTGVTTDLNKRLLKHNSGQGAKYTRARLPVSLAWSETAKNESFAKKREAALKKLSKSEKENLVGSSTPYTE